MKEITNVGTLLVAAAIGVAAGAGAALLLAPCSGKETREWLANRSRQLKFEVGKDATRRAAAERVS